MESSQFQCWLRSYGSHIVIYAYLIAYFSFDSLSEVNPIVWERTTSSLKFCDSFMEDLYDAALAGDLEQVTLLVEQGVDKNQVGGIWGDTPLSAAVEKNHFAVVQR